jgi:hypothetical protein
MKNFKKMKTIILSIIFAFAGNLIMSQPMNHTDLGRYLKTIEYNVLHPGVTKLPHSALLKTDRITLMIWK